MVKDVRRYAVNIVEELTTPATMSMELVTWAVILATRTKLATRVSDILQNKTFIENPFTCSRLVCLVYITDKQMRMVIPLLDSV